MLQKQLKCPTYLFVASLCALAGLSQSCTKKAPEPPTNPNKKTIVSLHPAITETIFALGKQDLLIGRSNYCDAPAAAKRLTEMGTSLTPNFETIARVKPKLVLTDQSAGTPIKNLAQITQTQQLAWLTKKDVRASILQLGSIVGEEEKAKQLSSMIYRSLESTATSTSPRMLVVMGGSNIEKGQIWYIRKDSIHNAAIEAAGFQNAAPARKSGPPQMSIEQLLAQDPDVIMFLPSKKISSDERQSLIRSLNVLPSLKAVQNKTVRVLNGSNLMGVGPSITTLVAIIRAEGQSALEPK